MRCYGQFRSLSFFLRLRSVNHHSIVFLSSVLGDRHLRHRSCLEIAGLHIPNAERLQSSGRSRSSSRWRFLTLDTVVRLARASAWTSAPLLGETVVVVIASEPPARGVVVSQRTLQTENSTASDHGARASAAGAHEVL